MFSRIHVPELRKWRRRSVAAIVLTPLTVAGAVLFAAAPADAKTLAVTYGYGTAWLDPDGYFGKLRDTTTPDGYCVEMQRLTAAGDWVTSGFWSGEAATGGTEIHVLACTTEFVGWHIRNTDAIHGLRLKRYASGPATNFCASQIECLLTL
jgi:hypothetical protein